MEKPMAAALLIVLGAAGVFNGLSVVSDPTGHSLGLRVDMLPDWHTWDYRISGLFVLIALGLTPLICAAAMIVDARGAIVVAAMIGLVTIGWVIWQIVVLDVRAPRAHVPLTALGAILMALAAMSLVRGLPRTGRRKRL